MYNQGTTSGIEWLEYNLQRIEWQEVVRRDRQWWNQKELCVLGHQAPRLCFYLVCFTCSLVWYLNILVKS